MAMPSPDSSELDVFDGGLVYVAVHNDRGAAGLIVNQLTTISFSSVFQELKKSAHIDADAAISEPIVYFGGPVDIDNAIVLHSNEKRYNSTVGENELLMTASKDVVIDYLEGKGPSLFLLALGHAGWSPGQLEKEIAENQWLSVKSDVNIIFDCPISERYQRAIKLLGFDPSLLRADAGHA